MNKKLFENYINLIISDSSIIVFTNTEFTSYGNFSKYISDNIKSKNYHNIESYLFPIINDLSYILSIPIKECAIYVGLYFKGNKWLEYYEPIKGIKKEFGYFLLP